MEYASKINPYLMRVFSQLGHLCVRITRSERSCAQRAVHVRNNVMCLECGIRNEHVCAICNWIRCVSTTYSSISSGVVTHLLSDCKDNKQIISVSSYISTHTHTHRKDKRFMFFRRICLS